MSVRRRRMGLIAVLLAGSLVAAACGDDDDDGDVGAGADTTAAAEPATTAAGGATTTAAASDETTTTAAAADTTEAAAEDDGEADPEGVLRRAVNLENDGGLSFDPASIKTGQYVNTYPVTAGLLKINADGEYEFDLADSVEVVDPSTIRVELKPDLQFSDGAPLDAQAAVNSIQRTKDAKAPGLRNAELALIASLTADSPTTFTIALSTPAAGLFYGLLADAETAPVSPNTINAPGDHSRDVVAAGPFKIESYEPGARVTMVKNDLYWDADSVQLAGIEYVHASGPEAFVNALNSGQADVASLLQFSSRAGLSSPVEAQVLPTTGAYQMNMCIRDDNPLGDVRVRQALNYATDRDAVNQLMFEGESTPAWSLVPEDDPLYNDELTGIYEYDPDRARQLLTDAGYPDGFEITSVVQAGDAQRLHEILQSQWAEVGVQMSITPSTNIVEDWYTANGSKGLLNAVPLLRLPTEDFTRNFSSTAFANACKTPVPEIDACATDLSALDQNSDAYVERYRECQATVVQDTVFGVMTVFQIQVLGVNTDRVGNLVYQRDPLSGQQPDVTEVFIKA